MARKIFIVDTNVVVSALISSYPDSPPVRILDAVLEGEFPYVMSTALTPVQDSWLPIRQL